MQYSKNYELNLPELADQFNLNHWNENSEKIDTQMKLNENANNKETNRATQKENSLSSAISTETSRATQKEETLSSAITSETSRATQKENAINSDLLSEKSITQSHRNNTSNPHNVTATQVGLGNVPNYTFETFWTKIKEKIASVLGLTFTNYSGTSAKATNDGENHNIANTYMSRAVDYKNGLIHTMGRGNTSGNTWTATEDCYMVCQMGSVSVGMGSLKVDGVELMGGGNNTISAYIICAISSPIKRGQVVYFQNGSNEYAGTNNGRGRANGCRFYRYKY